MELRQLRYFTAVADEGGFGRAAERLHIVQSAVSQQIGRLERELGVELFDRSARRIRVTPAGERLLPEARAVLDAVDRTRRVAATLAAGEEGVLRLGTVHGPGDRVHRLLVRLAGIAPRLEVHPERRPPQARLAAVRSGALDAALVRALPAPAERQGLELLPLWQDPLYVALPATHPLAVAEDPPGMGALAALPLRLAPRDRNPAFHDLVTGAVPLRAGEAPRLGPAFTDLQSTLVAIGAAREPSWTVFYEVSVLPRLPRTTVRTLPSPAVTTYLAVRPGPPPPAVRHLLGAARVL